jgi:hypothetical protein
MVTTMIMTSATAHLGYSALVVYFFGKHNKKKLVGMVWGKSNN